MPAVVVSLAAGGPSQDLVSLEVITEGSCSPNSHCSFVDG